jgi:hypothetical protein
MSICSRFTDVRALRREAGSRIVKSARQVQLIACIAQPCCASLLIR